MKKIIKVELNNKDIIKAIKEYCERNEIIEEDMVLNKYSLYCSDDSSGFDANHIENITTSWEYAPNEQ